MVNCYILPQGKISDTFIRCAKNSNLVCEKILSHTPVPARGKDKKQNADRWPHAGRTSIRDVIVMLRLRHHVACLRIRDFLEVFLMFLI